MAYSEEVLDHYNNPRNVGRWSDDLDDVGTGMVGAPACGDVMRLQIKVNDAGIIVDARFKTYGCGSAIASSSLLTEKIKGMSLNQASSIQNIELANELSSHLSRYTALFLLKMLLKQQYKTTETNIKKLISVYIST